VDSNWEVTPLMIGTTLYFGWKFRAAVALDAASEIETDISPR
jgi:hypothetical protein